MKEAMEMVDSPVESPVESTAEGVVEGAPGRAPGRAIVVGASSGIGAALVRALKRDGWRVAALARREGRLVELAAAEAGGEGEVFPHVHDAKNTAEVPELFEELVQQLGGLDLLIYAAAIMPTIAPDQYDTEIDLEILAVNTGGSIAWCNAAARWMQTTRRGTIVGISSIAGDRGRKGNPVYGTSKAAMNHHLEALRNRLSAFGVHVCTIRPGFVDTEMTQGMEGLFWLISADEAAKQILDAARRKVTTRYVPRRWFWVGFVLRLIPSFLFRRMSV
jgi:NAD(P)-dependent dehydrogenase (short-subunit alcohol dehydrogenase family)